MNVATVETAFIQEVSVRPGRPQSTATKNTVTWARVAGDPDIAAKGQMQQQLSYSPSGLLLPDLVVEHDEAVVKNPDEKRETNL